MKEFRISEVSDVRTPSISKRGEVDLLGCRIFIPFTLFLAAISACSPDSGVETRATLDLSAVPLSTPTQELQILEPESATCVNDARFVEDLTVPDGYQVEPGEVLDKRWGVLNAGNCDWGAGYRLIRIDDGLIEAEGELALYPARAGETGVWSVQITAPDQVGDQLASWQAQSPDGTFFGDPVFVLIEVGP
ncbi:MAG: NBR1-Ig-like domain-containing protein [Anaerolineales bacterium]